MAEVTVDATVEVPVVIEELTGRALDDALLGLEMERRRVEADLVAVMARADGIGHYAVDGHRTVAAWAEATCNWSPLEARRRRRLVRMGELLPTVVPALRDGVIGVAQVDELGRLFANPRARRLLADSEAVLVDQAQRLWFSEFQVVCRRWETLADADGAHRSHEDAHRSRQATAAIVGESFHLAAEGDVVAGVEMMEILDRFTDAEFHTDWDQARERFGDAAGAGLLERTVGQRRFDAVHTIFRVAAGAAGSPVGSEPLVNLVVDVDTYQHHLHTLLGQPAEPLDPATVVQRRCETLSGHPVDPVAVVAASLVGQVRRVVMDSAGRVLDVGRRRRLFTGAARDALRLADRECAWPGCHVPAGHAQGDHVVPHSRGGPSDVINGGLLCGRHNRFKHRGYQTRRDRHGHWHFHRPDGTEVTPRAPP